MDLRIYIETFEEMFNFLQQVGEGVVIIGYALGRLVDLDVTTNTSLRILRKTYGE